jgi:hypothetical protein
MSHIKIIRLSWQLDQFIDEQILNNWEQKTGYSLPEDYRAFLLKYNGGVIQPWMFRHNHPEFYEDDREMILDYLYDWKKVLKSSDLVDIPLEVANQPPGYIAIGQDPGVGIIMLSLQPNNFGTVIYWLRMHFIWGDEPNNVLGFIAPSFTAFLDGLYDDGETEHGYWNMLTSERQAIPLIL